MIKWNRYSTYWKTDDTDAGENLGEGVDNTPSHSSEVGSCLARLVKGNLCLIKLEKLTKPCNKLAEFVTTTTNTN